MSRSYHELGNKFHVLTVGTNLVVISQQLVEEVNSFVGDKALVLRGDEAVPGLLLEATQDIVVLSVELNLVLVDVVKEIIGAKNLGDLDELV